MQTFAPPVPRTVSVPSRIVVLSTGITMLVTGVALIIRSGAGTGPGDVFLGAISSRVGIAHGTAALILQVMFVVVAWSLGRRPGLGTVAVGLAIGPALNVALMIVPDSPAAWTAPIYAAVGLALLGFGIGSISAARFGRAASEHFVGAIAACLGRSESATRVTMELSFVTVGFLLGGPAGPFTLVVALTIGWLISLGHRTTATFMGATADTWRSTTLRLSRL